MLTNIKISMIPNFKSIILSVSIHPPMFQSWYIHSAEQTKAMFHNLFLLLILHNSLCTSSICSEEEKYNSKKAAQICFNKLLSKLDLREPYEWFDFGVSDCDKELENCFDQGFIIEMKENFFRCCRACQLHFTDGLDYFLIPIVHL